LASINKYIRAQMYKVSQTGQFFLLKFPDVKTLGYSNLSERNFRKKIFKPYSLIIKAKNLIDYSSPSLLNYTIPMNIIFFRELKETIFSRLLESFAT